MEHLTRIRSFAISLAIPFLASIGAAASPRDDRPAPPVRLHPIASAPAAGQPAVASSPRAVSDLPQRLRAAFSATRAPGEPVPHPASAAASRKAEPLAERIGRDVTLIRRPRSATAAQIRGERLQARVAESETDDTDLATARTFLRSNRRVLALEDPDRELVVRQRLADELGTRHLKFEQRWRGLPVFGAELIVHLDRQGDVYLLDGAYAATPKLASARPILTAADAVARAAASARPGATAGTPELVVYDGKRGARLAWKTPVRSSIAEASFVFVDAIHGAVLASISRVMPENVVGSGRDLNGQTVPLNVWNGGGTYTLVDTTKFMYDPTSQPPTLQNTRGAIFVFDARNQPPTDRVSNVPDVFYITSSNPNSWSPADSVSAAFGLSKTYDYYRDRHTRNSLDGEGGSLIGDIRVGQNFYNAFWDSELKVMVFGDADTFAGSIDVVAHELTHGVTSNAADLIYQDQSGAMNESFSDIFGEMVENYVTGSNDWRVGTQISAAIRNMANPHEFHDPAKMSEYVDTTDDHGGVHTNSGIFNYAYYQLVAGLPNAIGPRDAERIYYRALTVHLTKTSQFLDGRLACIQSAEELFGTASPQSQRVAQAFDVAEILPSTPTPPPPTTPPGSAADSVFFLAHNGTSLVPSRRETAFGDPAPGIYLINTPAAAERPAVSGDGTLAFFVTDDNDACFVATNGNGSPSCLDLPGTVASVAMSADANVYAFVLLDDAGERTNDVTVIDIGIDPPRSVTYSLVSPTADGGSVTTVLFADTMDFTKNQRYLLYDALNVLRLGDGTSVGLWSISAIDFSNSQTYTLAPPVNGIDIGDPSVAHTSDAFFTFDAQDQSSGEAAVFAGSLDTGRFQAVVTGVGSWPTTPSYTGNDRAIVYSFPDSSQTGRSLAIEQLAADHMTASGNPQKYLDDGAYGVIYRRGAGTAPGTNCTTDDQTLCLSSNRFQVSATFTTPQGQKSQARAVRLTADTGYFTFFDPNNVEVVVKVLNACSFSDRIWVFAGGLTNVATVLSVTDTATGVTRTYGNPQDRAYLPIQATDAFQTCFAGSIESAGKGGQSVEEARAEVARLAHSFTSGLAPAAAGAVPAAGASARAVRPASAEAPTACIPDGKALCLSNGRFRVETSFRTPQGGTGTGNAVRLTADTGYFWFFDQNNVEVVIKVLNACSFASRFWVFAAGLTNVEVTTTVTDTQTGERKTYRNALNTPFAPLQDTNAFATCP